MERAEAHDAPVVVLGHQVSRRGILEVARVDLAARLAVGHDRPPELLEQRGDRIEVVRAGPTDDRHEPVKAGSRFSAKAPTPSATSLVRNSSCWISASRSSWASRSPN